jgi:hypothetical protein
MAQNISLLGANYPDVPAVNLPKTGGGVATFIDAEIEDISSHVTPGTGVTLVSAKKTGHVVELLITTPKVTTANTDITLGTIDQEYRPNSNIVGSLRYASSGDFGYGFIAVNASGNITFAYSKTTSYGLYASIIYLI